MSAADKFITGSPLMKLIGQSPVPHHVVADFVGASGRFKGTVFALCSVSSDASELATVDAIKRLISIGHIREDLYTEIGESVFALEIKVQLLARTLHVLDAKGVPVLFAASADEIRRLESDEIGALFEHFLAYQEERSPIRNARSWEEVEGHITAVGKGSTPPSSLASYDSASLRFIVRELANRWIAATKPPSSDISPPSDSSI